MDRMCNELLTESAIAKTRRVRKPKIWIDKEASALYVVLRAPVPLSRLIKVLGNFGLEAQEESWASINGRYIYALVTDVEKIAANSSVFEEIFLQALQGHIVSYCQLYRLALSQKLNLESIIFLRAMIKYLDQLLKETKEASILKTFLRHERLVALIAQIFMHKRRNLKALKAAIAEEFKTVRSYEEDRLLQIYYNAVQSIQKTNFFKKKRARAFKFDLARFKHLLEDLEPNIEMFVYAPDFLGVHLRSSKIARGGIRWSTREDFRQEIKSLMITQELKNAIIIPSGGKGGIYIEKEVNKEEFARYYSEYIDALLDLVDKKPKPNGDFYFVVAADRGTADMSDVANAIALKKGYWLGDAFASGGSSGYSRKKLGVTAHGAWISAARHFIDRGIDIFSDPISVVGTGSMRGDVFGNGMLINPNIRLLGAISSREIFIDPDPDPAVAYSERKRLFEAGLGWSAYDASKISPGGGVFMRDAKEIRLSPQIKKLLGIKKDILSGEELARRLLTAKVDMLYIGGIGTYVKSSEELNIHIADKPNEPVRVNAGELRCYAVCEGGNLGLTQLARIEYAKNGGKINLDSIDNSAGVNTSDYEVNIKIVLAQAIQNGTLSAQNRDTILQELTQEVLEKVFATNYLQPLAITLDALRSRIHFDKFLKATEILEREVEFFNRLDFHIPKAKEFHTVLDAQGAIVRPVLGVLLSFAKIFIKNILLQSPLIDEPFFEHYIYKYFPKKLLVLFEKESLAHPLHREIIATVCANLIIDHAGVTFVSDYDVLGKEKFLIKIKAYLLLHTLLAIAKVKKELYASEKVLRNDMYTLLMAIEDSLAFNVRWAVHNYQSFDFEPFHILNYKQELAAFLDYDKSRSDSFFHSIDLLKFVMLAIAITEQTDYTLTQILKLIDSIIKTFGIDTLLLAIEKYRPKTDQEREIQLQLARLVELFVTECTKEVVHFTRRKENLQEGLERYKEEKMIDSVALVERIEEAARTPQDLTALTLIVHKLLLDIV